MGREADFLMGCIEINSGLWKKTLRLGGCALLLIALPASFSCESGPRVRPVFHATGVRQITGPQEVAEHGVAEYSTSIMTDNGELYDGRPISDFQDCGWSCVPAEAGIFDTADLTSTDVRFYPSETAADAPVTIEFTLQTTRSTFTSDLTITVKGTPSLSGWVRSWGGGRSVCHDVAVDGDGNIYVNGIFEGTVDFDPGIGADLRTSYEYPISDRWNKVYRSDNFLAKYSSSGEYKWVTIWKGPGKEHLDYITPWSIYGNRMTIDPDGNILIYGVFSDDQRSSPPSRYGAVSSYNDVFLRKIDPQGKEVWAREWNGDIQHTTLANFWWLFMIFSVATDSSGSVYAAGSFNDTEGAEVVDLDPGPGAIEYPTSEIPRGEVVLKLSPDGELEWSKVFSIAEGSSLGLAGAVDGAGNLILLGDFTGEVHPDPENPDYKLSATGSDSQFICKMDPSGHLVWARVLDFQALMQADREGNIYLYGGVDKRVDIDPGPDVHFIGADETSTGFVEKLSPAGVPLWAKTWGGSAFDLCIDDLGNITTCDLASNVGDPSTAGAACYRLGINPMYVRRLDSSGNELWSRGFPHLNTSVMLSMEGNLGLSCDQDGNAYFCSNVFGSQDGRWSKESEDIFTWTTCSYPIDFDPGPGVYYQVPRVGSSQILGGDGLFLIKIPSDGKW
jgi:hypothetical protein